MGKVEKLLSNRLQKTYKLYFISALENALSNNTTENTILQTIINIQAAIELFSKYFVLQQLGWKGIITEEFHNKSEKEILVLIDKGKIKTTPHWKNKDFTSKKIYINEDDRKLLDEFQNLRNQLMHLGMVDFSSEIPNKTIWLMVRIINQLNWQETLPINEQYLSNSLKAFLNEDLYEKLIKNSCYVGESIDRAYEIYPDDMKHCLECGHESWALNEYEERVCFVCGFKGHETIFGFTDCPKCDNENTIVYDVNSILTNKYVPGKCCCCREKFKVSKCNFCGEVSVYPDDCSCH